MISKIATSIKRSFFCNFFFLLFLIYLLLYQYARLNFYADPTSFFFNPPKAFAPGYSAQREEEATAFLENDSKLPFKRPVSDTNPRLCVGIASIAREGVDYLHLSTGSILEDLTDEERAQIELKVLIAHTDPSRHPSWNSSWLFNVADEVLAYTVPFQNRSYMTQLEGKIKYESEKSLFDFVYLLSACKDSGAEYVLMIEDDTVVAKGWYARTVEGLMSVRQRMTGMGYHSRDFLYLRLFYTTCFLGWNSEENTNYILCSFFVICLPLALFLIPQGTRPKILHPPLTILFLALIYTPMLIALYFLSGRPSVLPISRGVHLMPKYACCSQAIIFPSSSIDGIIRWLDWNREQATGGFQDQLIEEFADGGRRFSEYLSGIEATEGGGRVGYRETLRWAITPSLVQHIGKKSSKLSSTGGREKEREQDPRGRLWSFGFEEEGRRLNKNKNRRDGQHV